MKNRVSQEIEYLIKEGKCLTAKQVAFGVGLSERTVRQDFYDYMNVQHGFSVQLVSSRDGYEVRIKDPANCKEELEKINRHFDASTTDKEDKEKYVILRMLQEDTFLSLADMAEELYISQATMNRLFKNVKFTLEKYRLKTESKAGKGVRITGNELNKRVCMAHLNESNSNDSLQSDLLEQCGITDEQRYFIEYVIQKVTYEKMIYLTNEGINNLVIHLAFAISRIKKGKYVENISVEFEASKDEVKAAEIIVKELEQEFGILFPQCEMDYILIHLIGKRSSMTNAGLKISAHTEKIIYGINIRLKQVLGYDFTDDFELFSMLAPHIEPMLSRLQYGFNIPNPSLNEIKRMYPDAFECAVVASDFIANSTNLKVNEDELGYMAIHYNLALERLRNKDSKFKFAVVCGSGAGVAMLLKRKIMVRFSVQECDIVSLSLQELASYDLKNVDYILSTIPIPYKLDKKIIYLENVLADIPTLDKKEPLHLKDILDERLCFFHQEFESKEEVIDFLCNRINVYYSTGETFRKSVYRRESLAATDIGNMVAIPHPFESDFDCTVIAVCTLRKTVLWNTRKVKYIFLINYAKEDLKESYKVNETLMATLMDINRIKNLDNVQNFEQFNQIF